MKIKTALMTVFFMASFASPGMGWMMEVGVKVLDAQQRLIIGQAADAKDGIDGRYDVPAFLSGDVAAYMELDGGRYWKDIKTDCTGCTKAWELFIESRLENELITLRWNSALLPPGAKAKITDVSSGASFDMRKTSGHAYLNTGGRRFRVEIIR